MPEGAAEGKDARRSRGFAGGRGPVGTQGQEQRQWEPGLTPQPTARPDTWYVRP